MEPLLCFLGEDPRTPWVKARMSGYQPGNLDTATHIILPVPAFDRQGNIRGGPPLGEFTRCFRPGLTIFGGNLGHAWLLRQKPEPPPLIYWQTKASLPPTPPSPPREPLAWPWPI